MTTIYLRKFDTKIKNHHASVYSLTFSSDGRFVLTAGGATNAAVWDLRTGALVRVFKRHQDFPKLIVAAKRQMHAFTAAFDAIIRRWDIETGKELCALVGHERPEGTSEEPITCFVLSEDERYGFSGGLDATIRVWDLTSGTLLRTLTGSLDEITSICVLPGNRLLTGCAGDAYLRVWDFSTGELLLKLSGHRRKAEYLSAIVVNRSGTRAVSAGDDPQPVVWDLTTWRPMHSLRGHQDVCRVCKMLHTGDFVITYAEDKTIRLWDYERAKCLRSFENHDTFVDDMALSHDDRFLITASVDGRLRLFEVGTGRCLQVVRCEREDPLEVCAFSPDDQVVVAGGYSGRMYFFHVVTTDEESDIPTEEPATSEGIQLNLRSKPIPKNAPKFASTVVEAARAISKVKLDYSPASLEKVDKILQTFRKEGHTAESLAETLFCFGCYVGEVFVRHNNAKWNKDPNSPFGLVIQIGEEFSCDPIAKVFKRFENGRSSSVAYFYRAMTKLANE
jgi:WD40 repeat protein